MVLWFDSQARTYGLKADQTYLEEDTKAEEFAMDPSLEIEVYRSPEAVTAGEQSQFKTDRVATTGLETLRFNPDGFPSLSTPEVVIFRQPGNGELRVAQTRNRLSYEIQAGQPIPLQRR